LFRRAVKSMLVHMVTYPAELLGGSLLPWSIWFVLLLSRRLRERLRAFRDDALYLAICLAVTFPSVWLAPQASLRYYMPMFACVAVLFGIVSEGLLRTSDRGGCSAFICWYQRLLAVVMVAAGVVLVGISFWKADSVL